jgi:uncharacterized beta-barrel protein YwiB (DUF1934 family)
MKKDVLITVRGEQYFEGASPDETELVTEGTLEKTEEGWRLSYRESELVDMAGTLTVFDVHGDWVRLRRSGTLNSEMIFEKGKPHTSLYEVPFGTLTIDILTDELSVSLSENGGTLDIRYRIAVEHTVNGHNRFLVNVKIK